MLVIFDCDGVLVDSEVLASQVFSDCLKPYNISLKPEQCYRHFKGHTLDYCLTWLQQHYPAGSAKKVKKIDEHFVTFLENETEKAFAKSLHAVDGVEDVLKRLQERCVPFCVASNGSHKKISHSLSQTGLIKYFEGRQFSREDVLHGKPAPDLFLYAAEVMGVAAQFVKVVEDSFSGVKAARAAQMKALVFAAKDEPWHRDALSEDDIEKGQAVKDFHAMPQLMELLGLI